MLVALRWLHWLHAIALCNNSFLILLCSTILNYIYHLCALDVVASGIDDRYHCPNNYLTRLFSRLWAIISLFLVNNLARLCSVDCVYQECPKCHHPQLNLIIASRDHPDFIPEILSNFSRIRLHPDADKEVNNDIHRFIQCV
jgi:hypothetical protein